MEAIEMFGKEVPNALTPLDANHLLEINENAIKLEKSMIKVFNYGTDNLLYITKRGRTDL